MRAHGNIQRGKGKASGLYPGTVSGRSSGGSGLQHGIYVREEDGPEALFAEGTEEHLILGVDEEKGFVQAFWAPEFHVIGSRLYILFAVGGKVWGPQCHMMRLKEGGHIVSPDSWEEPVKVVRADDSPLSTDGITLDMTYLSADVPIWSGLTGGGSERQSLDAKEDCNGRK